MADEEKPPPSSSVDIPQRSKGGIEMHFQRKLKPSQSEQASLSGGASSTTSEQAQSTKKKTVRTSSVTTRSQTRQKEATTSKSSLGTGSFSAPIDRDSPQQLPSFPNEPYNGTGYRLRRSRSDEGRWSEKSINPSPPTFLKATPMSGHSGNSSIPSDLDSGIDSSSAPPPRSRKVLNFQSNIAINTKQLRQQLESSKAKAGQQLIRQGIESLSKKNY